MRKLLLAVLIALSSLAVPPTNAHTPYNLPNSVCNIQASNYLFCSTMGNININGTTYGVSLILSVTNIYQYPASGDVTSARVTLENWSNDQAITLPATGTYSDHHFTLDLSGGFTGTLNFDFIRLLPPPPCGRWCWLAHYNADNVVLVLQ